MSGGAILVAGTTSDAGKSLVATGICRWLRREGLRVAPFKAQNMSNNSMVVPDGRRFGEIGRAQWLQARAAGAPPEPAMNPVLLKPGSDRTSHVVLLGQPHGRLSSGEFATGRGELAAAVFAALDDLRSRFDVVVCEGAGSPAEINLRPNDFINMGLAQHAKMPVVVVGDIDRGGVLAAMVGTLALLDESDASLVAGWIVNKFRGDLSVLEPGLAILAERTRRPVLGVLPWLDGVWTDSEDALSTGGWQPHALGYGETGATLRVAVARLPRISNATDIDALATEPGVEVTITADADVIAAADLAVLPGSRATVSDLQWLRERGIAHVIASRARSGRAVLGICGGYQMLASAIIDDVESGMGTVPALGLLPTSVSFRSGKQLGLPEGSWHGHPVSGYEIHHGVVDRDPHGECQPFLDGWQTGSVWGTMWHGAFESDEFRRAWLTEVAERANVNWQPSLDAPGYADRREAMIEQLADAVDEHLDTDRLMSLATGST